MPLLTSSRMRVKAFPAWQRVELTCRVHIRETQPLVLFPFLSWGFKFGIRQTGVQIPVPPLISRVTLSKLPPLSEPQ